MVGVLSSLLYAGLVLVAVLTAPAAAAGADVRRCPPLRVALFTVGLNVFGFLAVAALSGYLAEGLRRADEQLVDASNQIADLQAFSQHVIDSLTSGLATTDIHGRILTFNRAAEAITGVPAAVAVGRPPRPTCCSSRATSRSCSARARAGRRCRAWSSGSRARTGRQIELGFSTARAHHAARRDRLPVHVPGRHRVAQARARGAGAAAAGRRRRDGRRHRPRDPQPAGVDVRVDSDPAPGAAADRGAVAADGHRPARVGSAERDDPQLPRVRAAAAARRRRAWTSGRSSPTRRGCCRTAPSSARRT